MSVNALLVACSLTATVSVEKLLRAAQMVALDYNDAAMASWCAAELQGYAGSTVPPYRILPARLMGTDKWGHQVPMVFGDAETDATVSQWPALLPIALIEQNYALGMGRAMRSDVPPELAVRLSKHFEIQGIPYHLIQVGSLGLVLSTVRQRIFQWALDAAGREPATRNRSAAVAAMLGMAPISELPASKAPVQPLPADVPPSSIYAGAGAQIVLVQNSSDVKVGRDTTTTTTNEIEALQALLSALEKARSESIAQGAQTAELEAVEGLIDEVKELVAMPKRRPGFVRSTVAAIGELAKSTATVVGAELAKPYAVGALATVASIFA